MATTHTLTGNLKDLVGGPAAISGIRAEVQAWGISGDGGGRTMLAATTGTEAGQVRIGGLPIVVGTDGTFTVTDLPATGEGQGWLPVVQAYRVVVTYRDPVAGGQVKVSSEWFELVADADLSDLVEATIEAVTTAAQSAAAALEAQEAAQDAAGDALAARTAAEAAQAGAEAARDEAHDISNIDTPDALVKTLIEDDDSETKAALAAAIVGGIEDPESDIGAALTGTIDEQTADAVAAAVAADETVRDAAALAADEAVDTALDTSSRIPREVADDADETAYKWRTKIGRRLLGRLTRTGYFEPTRGVILGDTKVRHRSDSRWARATLLQASGLSLRRMGEDTLQADGNVPDWVLTRWAARMPVPSSPAGRGIVCRGDSMTAGAFGGGQSYPNKLAALVSVPVLKRGYPGESSLAVARRMGALPIVTDADVTIPASGSTSGFYVNSAYNGFGWSNGSTEQGIPDGTKTTGWLGGVYCRMRGGSGQVILDRLASGGEAVTIPAGSVWVDEFESVHRDFNQIIWTGRNNISDAAQVLTATAAMVAHQTAGDYIVVSVCNATDEPSGDADYVKVIGINNALSAAYGDRFYDLRAWLISDGLAAVGITPTSDDTTAIGQDRIPPSLLAADGIHFNADGYEATAIGIHEFITGRNWL